MITLNLDEKVIELNTHSVDGKELYKAQDLLKGYGFDSGSARRTLDNWKRSINSRDVKITSHSIQRGKQSGTYIEKIGVLLLAGYVDINFHISVYKAFEELLEGNIAKAIEIATNKVYIEMAGHEFDRLKNDSTAFGVEAFNDLSKASDQYDRCSSNAGKDLASCRGKRKKRADAAKAIIERTQFSIGM